MTLQGIHHVSLDVHDVATTAPFYADVLGLRPIERPPFGFPGAWFEMPDGRQVHLIETAHHEAPESQHFALAVDNLEATIDQLRARGADVGEPVEIPGAGRQAFLRDPAGNLIELNQPTG